MRYLLFTFISFYAISCTQISKEEIVGKPLVDTSMVAIIPYDSTTQWVFEDGKPTELINSDLDKIEKVLEACINEYNITQQKRYNEDKAKYPDYHLWKEDYIIDLKRFKRQYVVSINAKGEKEVYVNCVCDASHINWKKYILIAKDMEGGNCFFNLKINITKETYYDLMVNGEA
jgi:hypothetical protein